MITRLKVNGFKNLVNVDVRFGAFTCIAGANGVGKSNLFDAIQFLSLLSETTLINAATSVRAETSQSGDIESLFHRSGTTVGKRMDFVVEMIVPQQGIDDFGQKVFAAWTFLRYSLSLVHRESSDLTAIPLEVINEELERIPQHEVKQSLLFQPNKDWTNSVIVGGKSTSPKYLYTESESGSNARRVYLRQDTGGNPDRIGHKRGSPSPVATSNLPRTVLSSVNSAERPTVLMAKREMQSWRQMRLEPSALRRPDRFLDVTSNQNLTLDLDGSHLPATLHRLYKGKDGDNIKSRIRNRLIALLDDVVTVEVDVDQVRQLLSLHTQWKDNTILPARSLSEGTLRFLALTVLEHDPEVRGVICLEEPENGIHPGRIKEMITLLKEIAVDVALPVGDDNPLRQLIVNTHSPNVVKLVDDDTLLVAELKETLVEGQRSKQVVFGSIPDTWRSRIDGTHVVAKGKLFDYLNPEPMEPSPVTNELPPLVSKNGHVNKPRRMKERTDLLIPSLFGNDLD